MSDVASSIPEDFAQHLSNPKGDLIVLRPSLIRSVLWFLVGLVLFGGASTLLALIIINDPWKLWERWYIGFILLCGVLFGLGLTITPFLNRGKRAILVPELGLLCFEKGNPLPYRWEGINRIIIHPGGMVTPLRLVRSPDGMIQSSWLDLGAASSLLWPANSLDLVQGERTYHLSPMLRGYAPAVRIIQEQLFERQWKEVLDSFLAGSHLDFGPVGISRDGIHAEAGKLSWRDLKDVVIKESAVVITKRGGLLPWDHVRPLVEGFPNLHVFMALVRTAQQAVKETRKS